MTPHCPVKFGTDGWRAVIGEDYTFENIRLVAQATADYFSRKQTRTTRKRLVVGYDPPLSGQIRHRRMARRHRRGLHL